MATSGVDRKLKVWDLRMYKELHSYKVSAGAGHLSFSQRGLLAASMGNIVEVNLSENLQTVTKFRKFWLLYVTRHFTIRSVLKCLAHYEVIVALYA